MNKIGQVSGVLDLSFEGLEHLAWKLFAELEKRATIKQGQGVDKGTGEKAKLSRELKNLRWGLTYNNRGESDGEGFGRRIRGSRSGAR